MLQTANNLKLIVSLFLNSIVIMSARQAGATSLGMQSENFGYSRVRLRRIKKLQFGVVNPNELVSSFIGSFVYMRYIPLIPILYSVNIQLHRQSP